MNPDPVYNVFLLAIGAIAWVICWLVPVVGLSFAGYYLMTLPLRRQERARFFLDLVESGMKDGRGLEQTVVAVSKSHDRSMGMRFHLLAARLEQGVPFERALDAVPRFLPAGITAMLRAGARAGDLRKMFPVCRQLLKDALSQTRGAINYVVVLAFVITPAIVWVMVVFEIFVLPKCLEVSANMFEGPPPAGLDFLARYTPLIVTAQFLLLALVWFGAFLYTGGPRLHAWLDLKLGNLADKVLYSLPWRRKRMQRDFSAALAILLDAGVTEADALGLAGQCADNRVFTRGVAQAQTNLRAGGKLTDAVALIDGTGEFAWRLSQAAGARSGFFQAIAGWTEALDARAFQQEQATAHLVTTGLLLLNGLFVATFVIGVFGMLISIIDAGLLW